MMKMVGRLRLSSIMWLNGCHKLAASPAYPTHPNPLYTHPNPQTPNIHTYHTATLKHSSKPCTGPKQTPYIDCWLTVYPTVECSDSLWALGVSCSLLSCRVRAFGRWVSSGWGGKETQKKYSSSKWWLWGEDAKLWGQWGAHNRPCTRGVHISMGKFQSGFLKKHILFSTAGVYWF